MKIYTKTGDKGTTSLFSGQRVPKNNPFIKALGSVDEGNCAIGLAISFLPKDPIFNDIRSQLEMIQHALFDVGAALATPRTCHQIQKQEKTRFDLEAIEQVEKWIDTWDAQLPPLKTFILPGGHPAGAALHLSRSIIRRAERFVTPLYEQGDVNQGVLIYLNRLSDYFFVAARIANSRINIPDNEYVRSAKVFRTGSKKNDKK